MSEATVGVDVGGTFTDVVSWDGAGLRTRKVSTTPDQSDGVLAGMQRGVEGTAGRLLHGTTVATNALLERAGARTALVTSEGFEDVIEIGRQHRPALYDPFADRPEPLVERRLRFGVPRNGDPPDLDLGDDIEAVAVSLLYSFDDPASEQSLADRLARTHPDIAVSLSSEVAPEFREFERTSTTVLNAYLSPVTATYLRHLDERARDSGVGTLAVMRSSGGLIPVDEAARLPAAILLSGPAGGVVAAADLGKALGYGDVVAFDMGGTSTDVCRIEGGRPEVAYERDIEGYPCRMPSVAVHTVGAGGGSIAWVDEGGSMRVGPRSAGATPGPAAYGRGGESPTVTDANVVLRRIDPEARLAGSLPLLAARSAEVLAALGAPLGLDAVAAAEGVVRIVEEVMAGAVRKVSIEQGADPRRSVLVAFGGAGGLHATSLARRLDMAGVVVPVYAGVFSALGLLLSPPRSDAARTVLSVVDAGALDAAVADVVAEASAALASATDGGPARHEAFVDVRYLGQSHELAVPYRPGEGWAVLADRFHDLHLRRNGFHRPTDPIEPVTVRCEVIGEPALRWEQIPPWRPVGDPERGTRMVRTGDGDVEAAVFDRSGLEPGTELIGPAVVEEREATTYLGPGERAVVHESGALEIAW